MAEMGFHRNQQESVMSVICMYELGAFPKMCVFLREEPEKNNLLQIIQYILHKYTLQWCLHHKHVDHTLPMLIFKGFYAGKLLLLLKLDEKWYPVYVIDAAA